MIALCYMPVCMDVFFDFRHDFVLIFAERMRADGEKLR